MADVLVDDEPRRTIRLGVVGGGLLLTLVAGGAALRSTLPPPALDVRLAGVSGTALRGESFVRLHVGVEHSGARGLEDAVLTVAGTTQRGSYPAAFDDDGRLTVQVDLAPVCASVQGDVAAGVLELRVLDESGDARQVALRIPADDRLERLLRYRCS